ncbi:J domain-containing protein [Novosphingobium ginsenosidimutans]|uniref:Molecular chaperone DnaJ n=2 Tax=Novosphingobium ginsenosidimutans TaxID=1176536 RepID=A0A5B8S260_9SPHN|nr:molecular chaperone DnaJ [Novosphingobium ginsenosidimutans]
MMNAEDDFIDYYKILQVDPDCDDRALEAAYRNLAKMFHPDHTDTADVEKFSEVVEAYRAIRDQTKREAYNVIYSRHTGYEFSVSQNDVPFHSSTLSDAEAHARILNFLYRSRRENAQDAGVGRYFVQEMLGCSDESFEFHLWYLKAKGYIETTEQGTLAITIDGVDHVITTARTAARDPLRITRTDSADGGT